MIRLISKAPDEWYWREGNQKMVGPFPSEYAATRDARKASDDDEPRSEHRNFPRREDT